MGKGKSLLHGGEGAARHSCPLWPECSRGAAPFTKHKRAAGQLIYLQGEVADRVFLLQRGSVTIHRMGAEDHALGLTRELRMPGSFLGLECLIGDHYNDSARAETDVTFCSANQEAFSAWLGESDSPALRVLRLHLETEAQESVQHGLAELSARQRVCNWLLRQRGRRTSNAISRKVIAEILGMRAETLSRVLHELADEGLVEVSRRHILLLDPEGVAQQLPGWNEASEIGSRD